MKKKRAYGELNSHSPIQRNNLIHEIECLKREMEEWTALIESLREEALERAIIHEEVVSKLQRKTKLSHVTVIKPKDVNRYWK